MHQGFHGCRRSIQSRTRHGFPVAVSRCMATLPAMALGAAACQDAARRVVAAADIFHAGGPKSGSRSAIAARQVCCDLSSDRLRLHAELVLVCLLSDGFLDLSGYDRSDILLRNCRFLQGPGTQPAAVDRIRAACKDGTHATEMLLNYRKDGVPFWSLLRIIVGSICAV